HVWIAEWIVLACKLVERLRAAGSGEVVSPQPVLARDDRIGRNRADGFDKARQVKRDLRIGRPIIYVRRRNGLGFAQFVDLDHPGDDRAACVLPYDDTD